MLSGAFALAGDRVGGTGCCAVAIAGPGYLAIARGATVAGSRLAPAAARGAGVARADVDGNGQAHPGDGAPSAGYSSWPLAGHANAEGLAACV